MWFNLKGNHDVWWIPGDWDIYEHLYSHTKLSEIDALKFQNRSELAQSYIPYNAVNTPLTMLTEQGKYISIHEANLTDYPGMTLRVDTAKLKLSAELVGNSKNIKAVISTPFKTPWRTIQFADRPGNLIESRMILNLNEPAKFDVPWFKPTKYMGIWWDMHIGTKTWDYASGRHGATTEYAKKYIDFCAENGIGALLVEGWNTGWEHWFGDFDREGVFDFVTPYPDYDLQEVVSYGKSKGVEIIMHHETSAAPRTYDEQMDTAYALMNELGISTVKTGYVGKIIPKGEYHHGQWMVKEYRKAVIKAAEHQIAVNAHEPIKDTGIRRTYPNAISREGMRGQEFNAWSPDGGNPPDHLPTVAFTRMLAGPFDFTPGIFNIKLDPYKPNNQINTTLAQQLALYVVIYSPVQMVPDLIENYEGHPAFQFIRDVGVDWDETPVLNGSSRMAMAEGSHLDGKRSAYIPPGMYWLKTDFISFRIETRHVSSVRLRFFIFAHLASASLLGTTSATVYLFWLLYSIIWSRRGDLSVIVSSMPSGLYFSPSSEIRRLLYLPRTKRNPSGSMYPISPVNNQPFRIASLVAVSFFQYPFMIFSPRMTISPF